MSEYKVQFIVMESESNCPDVVVTSVGDNGRFNKYEDAEGACKSLAEAIPEDLMGRFPDYWIKKVFTK